MCKSILKGVTLLWQLDRRILLILKILALPLVIGQKCAGNSSKLQGKYVSVVECLFWARRIDISPSLIFFKEDVSSKFDNFREFATACQLHHLYSSAHRKKTNVPNLWSFSDILSSMVCPFDMSNRWYIRTIGIWKLMCGGPTSGVKKGLFSTKNKRMIITVMRPEYQNVCCTVLTYGT